MCDPCRCLRRCISCHGGCCPRPSCCAPCSVDTRNCRVVFPGEYQKFSDMVPPSFLQKQPKPQKRKKRSKSCTPCVERCKDPCADTFRETNDNPNQDCEKERAGIEQQNPAEFGQDDGTGYGFPGAGSQQAPGAGFGFRPGQPTIIPCYGTYGPAGNAMIFGIPPPTPYGNFGVPGPMVLPVAEGHLRGPPAAGLPTKYSSKFNPCTGEIYQCENQQMSAGRPTDMGQGPSYTQFCEGIGMNLGPNNPCNPFNETHLTIDQRPAIQNNILVGPPAAYSHQSQAVIFGPNSQNYNCNAGQRTLDSTQVPQSQPSTGQVRQGGTRSRSVGQPSEFRALQAFDPQGIHFGPNNLNNPRSQGKTTFDSRSNVQAKSPVVHDVSRSKSQRQRSESRGCTSGKPSEFRGAKAAYNGAGRNVDPRSVPRSMPSGDVRTHDSRRRNKSMGAPLNRQPGSNIVYTQNSVGMGIDPSNQYYPYNDCAPLNATFVHQRNLSNEQPCQDNNVSTRNISKEGPEKRKNSSKCQSSKKGSDGQPIKCYCTRFDPHNQYYPYYISEESDCPPPANKRPAKEQSQRKDCSELLSRVPESCPPCDLQKWCHLLMPKAKRKDQVKPAVKKKKKPNGASKTKVKAKMSKQDSKEMIGGVSYAQTPNHAEEPPSSAADESQGSEEANCPGGCKNPCPTAPPPPAKPEMRNCGCSANLPEENESQPAPCGPYPATTGCTACCNPCPWSWCFNPCNGCYYYCANCCNGCCNCCNYCCSPCGRCGGNSPSQLEKIPPKPKQKPAKMASSRRNSAGGIVNFDSLLNNSGCCGLSPPPGVPMQSVSTLPGYRPTAPPYFCSPYSGRWVAGGVDINRANQQNYQSPSNITCMRHG
ncbi:uncharacterized protein LOC108035901 [Drosophila biarmipes]|uniref:uncharacterized protein LOC108035901 n=1 Tax=Drosophila biarmipes TaxID=125945 RepID=UPI0007E6787C|nr:uncharacterized protein LOC108035901 [Drosophila biarmipes]